MREKGRKQQAWKSKMHLYAGLKCGVVQFKGRGKYQLMWGKGQSNREGQ